MVAAMLTTGSFASVLAGNTADTSYEFHNTNVSGNTGFREKNDTTKVYIHPTSGPELYFTVQAANSSYGSNCISASGRYRVGNSVQASLQIGFMKVVEHMLVYILKGLPMQIQCLMDYGSGFHSELYSIWIKAEFL